MTKPRQPVRLGGLMALALCMAGAAMPVAAQLADAAAPQLRASPGDALPAAGQPALGHRLRTVVTPQGLMLEDPARPMWRPATEGGAALDRRTAEPVAQGLPGVLQVVVLADGRRLRQLLVGGVDVQSAPVSPSGAPVIDQAVADGSHQWVLAQDPTVPSPARPADGVDLSIVDVLVAADGVPLAVLPAVPDGVLVRYRLVWPDRRRAPQR